MYRVHLTQGQYDGMEEFLEKEITLVLAVLTKAILEWHEDPEHTLTITLEHKDARSL